MPMGPTHAMFNTAGWFLAAPVIGSLTSTPMTLELNLLGAGVCAGAGLLPDWDSPGSTVARSFGILSAGIARLTASTSSAVYHATRGPRDNRSAAGTHRYLTHTLLGMALFTAAVFAACTYWGRPAALALLFVMLGLAVRGLMGDWARRNGWIAVTAVAAAGTWAGWLVLPERDYAYLAAATGLGCVLHGVADSLTSDRVPWLAPFVRIRGRRWRAFGVPRWLTFDAGGPFESRVLLPLVTLIAALGLLDAAVPGTAHRLTNEVMDLVRDHT